MENEEKSPRGLLAKALLAEKKLQEPIVEKDGIFSIKQNLETSKVVIDPEFKALVDSVLG